MTNFLVPFDHSSFSTFHWKSGWQNLAFSLLLTNNLVVFMFRNCEIEYNTNYYVLQFGYILIRLDLFFANLKEFFGT